MSERSLCGLAQQISGDVLAIADILEAMASGEITGNRTIEGSTIQMLAELLHAKGEELLGAGYAAAGAELDEMRAEIKATREMEAA